MTRLCPAYPAIQPGNGTPDRVSQPPVTPPLGPYGRVCQITSRSGHVHKFIPLPESRRFQTPEDGLLQPLELQELAQPIIGQGLVIQFSGPVGSGKGTLSREIMKRIPGSKLLVTCTTRPARSGETNGGHYWSIDIRDRILLLKIRNAVRSGHAISKRQRKSKTGVCYTYRLQIGSKEMCDDLHALGFWHSKTNGMTVPFVPDEIFRDFVRGYFDGDGHVWTGTSQKGGVRRFLTIQTVFTSCSLVFLEQLSLRLEACGVGQGRICRGKGSYYRLVYSVKSSLKIHNFMYNGLTSSLFLQRKRAVFEKFKENAAVAQR